MSTNKHAMIRYQALDRCFSRRYGEYYIEDLISECNRAIYEFTGVQEGVKRRTVFNDIAFMESPQGWNAPIRRIYVGKRCYYRYSDPDFSINKKDFSEAELDRLDEALVMLNRFKGAEGFDWVDEFVANFEDKLGRRRNTVPVIGYEKNPYLKGLENLSVIYNCIVNRQVIKVTYSHFTKGELVYVVHPYYLKQYNNRWFLFGVTERDRTSLTNLPLDRIVGIEPVHIEYLPNTGFDFEGYFEDVVGVTVPKTGTLEKVVLRFDRDRYPYVMTKPLHPSQRELDPEGCVVEIEVFINRELESLILSYGDQVEVLAPASLRGKMKERFRNALSKYK